LNSKLQHAAFAVCVSYFGRSQLMRLSNPDQWKKSAIVHYGVDSAFLTAVLNEPPSAPRFACVDRFSVEQACERAALQATMTLTRWLSGGRAKEESGAGRAVVLPSFSVNMPVVVT